MTMTGGTPGEEGGTREMCDDEHATDPATRAYIHILRGVGLPQQAIADAVGLEAKTAVQRTLRKSRDRIEDGEDPIDVWLDVVEPLYANDPEAGDAN